MRRLAKQPLFWTLLQALVVMALLQASGRFAAQADQDTQTYLTVRLDSLEAALSHIRTLGYPLFLRGVQAATGTIHAAPYFHFLCYVLAAIVFGAALRAVGLSAGARGAAASVLLWSHAVFEFTGLLLPDSLAVSAAIVSMAMLLVAVRPARSLAVWFGLAAAVFATWQIRPAYLFLPLLAPVLGIGLTAFVYRAPLTWRRGGRLFAALTLAAVGPLLAFCVLRWLATGHLGVVSFGGYNLIGISGQLLDEELARELPEEVRPLARAILQRRQADRQWEPPENYGAMERRYNPTVWRIAIPAAQQLYGDDPVRINRAVGQLAREVILRRPGRYLRWLVWSGREGLRSLLLLFITDKGTRLCLLALLGLEAAVVARRWRTGGLPPSPPPSEQRFVEVNALLWPALAFAAAKLLLVIAVEVPNHRYLSGAVVFAPTVAAVLAWRRWVQVAKWAKERGSANLQ